jgi:DNA-binding sugar fermentation-stimulating protein
MNPVYSLPKALIKAKVLARPSKKVKSPYLADILIDDKEYLCHSAPLGCSGHIVEGSIVWVLEKEKSKSQSTHEIYLIEENNVLIGCHPLVANKIAHEMLKKQLLFPDTTNIMPEKTLGDCRFDFSAKSDNTTLIIEVKSVPIADYIDGTTKEVQNYLKENPSYNEKIAIFPYCTTAGKRKVSNEPLSERALKHVTELTKLVKSTRCVLLFIIQRTDVSQFCITKLDLTYKEACKKALEAGVNIKAISVRWDKQHCYYEKDLEIVW